MFHSKPTILKQRIQLTKEELSVNLELAAVHRAYEVDLSAVDETKSDIHSYLVSDVRRNIVTAHKLGSMGAVGAAEGVKSHIDHLDSAYMNGAHKEYIHHVGITMERFFDENDSELEVKITTLTRIKDLQRQPADALTMRASLQALDWRRSRSGSLQVDAPDYISSTNQGACSANYQAVSTNTSLTFLPDTNNELASG